MSEAKRHFVADPACSLCLLPYIFTEVGGTKDGSAFCGYEPFIVCPGCQDIEPLSVRLGDGNLADPVAGYRGFLFPSPDDCVLHLDIIRMDVAFE